MLNEYKKLTSHLIRSDYYLNEFKKAVDSELYNYSSILIWKTIMLYFYERIHQTRQLTNDEVFKKHWEQGKLSEKQYSLEKYSNDNIFIFNDIEDEAILKLGKRLFDLDENLIKALLYRVKHDRDTAAHVADETLNATEIQIQQTLQHCNKVIEKIEASFCDNYLFKAINEDPSTIQVQEITHSSFKHLLNAKILEGLKTSPSFDTSSKLMRFISDHIEKLEPKDIENILSNSLENKGMYNQVIDAVQSYGFFNRLLKHSYMIGVDLSSWKSFYLALDVNQKKHLKVLKESLIKNGVEFDDEQVDLSEIPF